MKQKEGSKCNCKAVFILLCHCKKEHAGEWYLSLVRAANAAQTCQGTI